MTLVARAAPVGLAIDCDFALTSAKLTALKAYRDAKGRPVLAVGRYVGLPGVLPGDDLTAEELALLCGAGFACFVIQHPRYPGWSPAASNGAIDGQRAANLCMFAGYPKGCHVYQDIEGVKLGTNPLSVIQFAEEWSVAVAQASFACALYRGFDSWLTPGTAYALPRTNSYYLAPGQLPTETRGDAIVQGETFPIPGVGNVDRDEIAPDLKGELPLFAYGAPEAVA
jgi:hypothetical protein